MNWNIDPTMVALGGSIGANIGGAISDWRKRDALSSLGSDLKNEDYLTAGQRLIAAGDLENGLTLLKLGNDRKDISAVSSGLGQLNQIDTSVPYTQGQQQPLGSIGAGAQGLEYNNPAHVAIRSRNDYPDIRPSAAAGSGSSSYLPMFAQAGTRYSISPNYLARTAQIESGMNPNAHNASGADGMFQFIPSTAKRYNLVNPRDPAAAADAAAHLAADNRRVLVAALGRNPTDAELYLAHQQGADGAAKLLTNPNAPAASIVGRAAVVQNGGRPDMTAGQFAGMWLNKFGGAPSVGVGQSAPATGRDPVTGQTVPILPGGALAMAPQQPQQQAQAASQPAQPQQVPDYRTAQMGVMQRMQQIQNLMSRFGGNEKAQRMLNSQMEIEKAKLDNLRQDENRSLQQQNHQQDLALRERQLADPPSAIKEFQYARANGFTGSFEDFKQLSRAATTVNIEQKGEGAFTTKTAEGIAKRFQDLSDEGATARTDMALLSQLNSLGQQIDTGAGAAVQNTLAGFGIKVGSNVGKVEAFGAIIDKLTPQQRVPGTGATSDFEMKVFKSALPSLIKTPEGNSIVMSTLAGLAQQKIDRAAIAERAQIGEIDYKQAVKEMQALPSPFESFKKFQNGEFAPKQQGGAKLNAAPTGLLDEARAAIKAGKPKDAVMQRIREKGYDPSGL